VHCLPFSNVSIDSSEFFAQSRTLTSEHFFSLAFSMFFSLSRNFVIRNETSNGDFSKLTCVSTSQNKQKPNNDVLYRTIIIAHSTK